jgi:hypothetical protein
MREFQMRYSDDEEPIVWFAVAGYYRGRDGTPVASAKEATSPHMSYRVGADLDPLNAMFRLLDDVVDGAMCAHCGRPTGFVEGVENMPLAEHVCWYIWDPESKSYMRGCEARDA